MTQAPRLWDWEQIIENGDFKKTDEVLETGAMFGMISGVLYEKVKWMTVTDSYHWATRSFTKGDEDVVGLWESAVKILPNTTLLKMDMQDLNFLDNSFDKVVSVSAIEHVDDDRKAMEEMMRVLKPRGLLLLTTEYGKSERVDDIDGSFYRVYDDKDIERLMAGFKVVKKEIANRTIFLSLQK